MSSSSPVAHASPHLRKPLDTQRDTGRDMSMMFFAQPDCPSRFAHQNQPRIKGLNAETLASIFLPPPSWLLAAEYAPLRSDVDDSSTSIFFSLNLSIYNQPIVASEWIEEWFFMNGRVHPYALAWEVEQHDGLESDAGRTLLYTMPALIVRDQGYQPFPLILGPGNPDKTPFRGFHPFQVFVIFPIHTNPWAILCKKMTERRDSQFQPNAQFTCTGKVAGLLDHRACQWQGSQPSIRQQPAAYEIGRLNPGARSFRDKSGRSECADYRAGGANGQGAAREEKKGGNPNRRFMALAEALAAEEALPNSKEAEIEVDVDEVELMIEVGVRSEDESEDFMVVRKHCQRTRSGWEVKNLRRE
ncbi:hypothetical protein MRS44_017575 [Fusarium solani]|uniref:uncharacterized protein n=1 Tax=Fusarium solani TaxID=169388 RepID=UPI0032C3DDEA|nr:hypothetical protein MRS44_017575 [Fusarium solani]